MGFLLCWDISFCLLSVSYKRLYIGVRGKYLEESGCKRNVNVGNMEERERVRHDG